MNDVLDVLDELEDVLGDLNNPFDIETIKDFIYNQRTIYGEVKGECAC